MYQRCVLFLGLLVIAGNPSLYGGQVLSRKKQESPRDQLARQFQDPGAQQDELREACRKIEQQVTIKKFLYRALLEQDKFGHKHPLCYLLTKYTALFWLANAVVSQTDSNAEVKNTMNAVLGTLAGVDYQRLIAAQDHTLSLGKQDRISFADIAGGLPEEIETLIQYNKNPLYYQLKFNAQPPKGLILYGPPGTGKTLIGQAIAHELDAYFFYLSASRVFSSLFGSSAQRIREIFTQAGRVANAGYKAVIFIDEMEAIGAKRGSIDQESRKVVTELLAQLDGAQKRTNCFVIGATNFLEELDDALIRSGRFDYKIKLELPDNKKRQAILQHHAKKLNNLARDLDYSKLAHATEGLSCADLSCIVNEAALKAMREDAPLISQKHFDQAVEAFKADAIHKPHSHLYI